jgi:hypothetical protein
VRRGSGSDLQWLSVRELARLTRKRIERVGLGLAPYRDIPASVMRTSAMKEGLPWRAAPESSENVPLRTAACAVALRRVADAEELRAIEGRAGSRGI